jgi:hypothetical protein
MECKGIEQWPSIIIFHDLVRIHFPNVGFIQEIELSIKNMCGLLPKIWGWGQC